MIRTYSKAAGLHPISAFGGDASSENISPAPAHRDPLGNSLLSPIGGEKSPMGDSQYGYRRGGTFDSPKVPKSDLG